MPSRTEGGLRPAHQPPTTVCRPFSEHSTPAKQTFTPNADPNGMIICVLWELKKAGKADATIKNVGKALRALAKHADLDNPDSIKTYIATADKKHGYKRNLVFAYDQYAKIHGLTWNKPVYYQSAKMPKIPHEEKINCIIANSSKKLATALAISRDTGLRPVELMNLKLRNIDLQNGAVYPETAKHGSPRVLKLRNSTLNMLNKYLARQNIRLNDNLFGTWNSNTYGKNFRYTRNRTAEKTADLSIKAIRLYDLRHYFATMTYHKTKDLLFVKQQMGHRKIETTLIYTQLLHLNEEDEYTTKVSTSIEDDAQLIEHGFQYVTERDRLKLFKKRK